MSAPTVRPITKEELFEYFQYINSDGKHAIWSQGQAQLISDAMLETQGWRDVVGHLVAALIAMGANSAMASALVMGLQCGREFENRLMAKAIREGK